MRKIVVSMFMSLDGVTESPEKWSIDYWNDDIEKLKNDELFGAGLSCSEELRMKASLNPGPRGPAIRIRTESTACRSSSSRRR